METKIYKRDVVEAAKTIRRGGLVAVPTETVYGLAGNGLDVEAVEKIYEVKGRPAVKPLSLMVPDESAMEKYCRNVPPEAHALAKKFWPGPLTVVLRSRKLVPEIVRAGGHTVGLRCPDHKRTLALLKAAGVPFAAPSANPSGAPSPKNAGQVLEYFDGKIDAVLDGGECGLGRESTIIDMSSRPYKILRQGALPAEEIAGALAEKMKIIGITGGTGTGKTTALRCLERRGALVIDCDEVYHGLLQTDAGMLAEIAGRFPDAAPGGKLDRKALGAAVFGDAGALEDLNAITHKYISARVDGLLRDWAMAGGTLAAVDAVALIESGLAKKCSYVVGVTADREKRISRVMKRDGVSREYAELRVNAQPDDEFYRKNCNRVLRNTGTKTEFKKQCEALFMEVLQ